MSSVKSDSTDPSQKLSVENLVLPKAKNIQHLEVFCDDVEGHLTRLGVSDEVFKTPPSLTEIQIVNRMSEDTLKKLWQEESRKSAYEKTIQFDGVDHTIRNLSGQFYALPIQQAQEKFNRPKRLTDEQVVEFKLRELDINDPNTQVEQLFTVMEKLDEILVGNPFYNSYRKYKLSLAVFSWEEAEAYFKTYHTSVVVCSSSTVINQVKKALYPAAMKHINGEIDVPRILNRLKIHSKSSVSDKVHSKSLVSDKIHSKSSVSDKIHSKSSVSDKIHSKSSVSDKIHSKAPVSDNMAESLMFLLDWNHHKRNDFTNVDSMKQKILDSYRFIEECVVNDGESVFITLASQIYKRWVAMFDNCDTQEALETREQLKSGVYDLGESKTSTVNVLLTQLVDRAKDTQDIQGQARSGFGKLYTPEQKRLRR
jgi:hypothetical protein